MSVNADDDNVVIDVPVLSVIVFVVIASQWSDDYRFQTWCNQSVSYCSLFCVELSMIYVEFARTSFLTSSFEDGGGGRN